MYAFLTGPMLWFSFLVFFVGMIVRVVSYIRGLDWKLDRVTYRLHVAFGIRGAVRSIVYWLLPFGTRSWREKPGMAALFFLFHLGLIVTPLFLLAHTVILRQRWGVPWLALPEPAADALTILMIVAAILLALRRIALPEVRLLTTAYDYFILAVAVAPFVTGFLATHLFPGYSFWLIAHVIAGEVMLIAIPFTKLSHLVVFFLTRAQLGMDFGIKRGGMKRDLSW